MKKTPQIGQRVRYSHENRTCIGIVQKIWPKRIVVNDDELIADDDAMPQYGAPRPESEWQVTLKPDTIPDWWPYKKPDGTLANDKFCPSVSELQPA